jgi:hypothetical protein
MMGFINPKTRAFTNSHCLKLLYKALVRSKLEYDSVVVWSPFYHIHIQGDCEGCADILTCDKTPQKVTIEPIMPYTDVDIS